MADRSLRGKEYPAFSWLVERGKMREFVQAIGDNNPIYLDRQAAKNAGYEDTPASSTYITVPAMWENVIGLVAKDMEINSLKMLHGEQNYEYFQEIYPGDILTGCARIIGAERKSGKTGVMDVITVEITYTNQRNERVLRVRSILVERLQ